MVHSTLFGRLYWLNTSNKFFFQRSYQLFEDFVYIDTFSVKKNKGIFRFYYKNDTRMLRSFITIKDYEEIVETKLTTFHPIQYDFYGNGKLITDKKEIQKIIKTLL